MKNLNWLTMSQITMDEMTAFLQWLNGQPHGRATLRSILDCPINSGKLSGTVRGLDQLDFVFRNQAYVEITDLGHAYLKSEAFDKKVMLRRLFSNSLPVERTIHLLERSFNGRLTRLAVADLFRDVFGAQVTDVEIQGFINWANAIDLFRYSADRSEIVRLPELQSERSPHREL
jgi:hypothetical protein